MLAGLEGRRNVTPPANWREARERLNNSGNAEVRQLALRVSQIFGDRSAAGEALALVRDSAANSADRRSALQSLVTQRNPQLKELLKSLLDDGALRIDAIRAYAAIENENAPELILSRYAGLGFQGRRAAVETLTSRKNYAQALLAAMKNKTVPKADLPVYLARSLSSLLGKPFTRYYGDISELSQDKAAAIAKYKKLLTTERLAKADVHKGRQMFQAVCASCHTLYGEGGELAPDLTGSNRADIDYILLNMIDPSADIPDACKLVTIQTRDGQSLAGTIAQEDDQRVVIRMVGQTQTVLKSDIANRQISRMSMMPEGLLTALPDNMVLDLVKYLQTKKPVALP